MAVIIQNDTSLKDLANNSLYSDLNLLFSTHPQDLDIGEISLPITETAIAESGANVDGRCRRVDVMGRLLLDPWPRRPRWP